ASCFRHATASLPAPGSRPFHRTSPSRHRACVWTPPLHAPRLPLSVLPPLVSAPRSSALPCACSSTYSLPLSFAQIILSFVRKQGSRSNARVDSNPGVGVDDRTATDDNTSGHTNSVADPCVVGDLDIVIYLDAILDCGWRYGS